jgi:hypothetical protein
MKKLFVGIALLCSISFAVSCPDAPDEFCEYDSFYDSYTRTPGPTREDSIALYDFPNDLIQLKKQWECFDSIALLKTCLDLREGSLQNFPRLSLSNSKGHLEGIIPVLDSIDKRRQRNSLTFLDPSGNRDYIYWAFSYLDKLIMPKEEASVNNKPKTILVNNAKSAARLAVSLALAAQVPLSPHFFADALWLEKQEGLVNAGKTTYLTQHGFIRVTPFYRDKHLSEWFVEIYSRSPETGEAANYHILISAINGRLISIVQGGLQ